MVLASSACDGTAFRKVTTWGEARGLLYNMLILNLSPKHAVNILMFSVPLLLVSMTPCVFLSSCFFFPPLFSSISVSHIPQLHIVCQPLRHLLTWNDLGSTDSPVMPQIHPKVLTTAHDNKILPLLFAIRCIAQFRYRLGLGSSTPSEPTGLHFSVILFYSCCACQFFSELAEHCHLPPTHATESASDLLSLGSRSVRFTKLHAPSPNVLSLPNMNCYLL